jgi:hypothetical protein
LSIRRRLRCRNRLGRQKGVLEDLIKRTNATLARGAIAILTSLAFGIGNHFDFPTALSKFFGAKGINLPGL